MADDAPHILVIDAPYYQDISNELIRGATAAIDAAGATWQRVSVPGVLEIPAALSIAIDAMEDGDVFYDGFVVLGCVIRGETSHYDIVANESARAVYSLVVEEGSALGNGILTVENSEQAWVRARVSEKNKGADAAEATLALVRLRGEIGR